MADKKNPRSPQTQWDNHNQPVAPLPAQQPGEWQHPSWPIPAAREEKRLVVTEDYKKGNEETYDLELDLIIGKEIDVLERELTPQKIEENLQLAFRKMHKQIDEAIAQGKAKRRERKPPISLVPLLTHTEPKEGATPFKWDFWSTPVHPLEEPDIFTDPNKYHDLLKGLPVTEQGKKISQVEAEKIVKYIKGLPAGNDATTANPTQLPMQRGNKIVFVNGLLMFGSPEGGSSYWDGENSGFVTGAKKYFSAYQKPYFTNIDHDPTSTAENRYINGLFYATEHLKELTQGMDKDKDYFEFVTHSMGTAEAAGISDFLKMNEWKVKDIYSFEAMQAADILINKSNTNDNPTIILDYQYTNDWVINDIPIASSPGNIKGADIVERRESKKGWLVKHREPIDDGEKTWDEIKQYHDKMVNSQQTK